MPMPMSMLNKNILFIFTAQNVESAKCGLLLCAPAYLKGERDRPQLSCFFVTPGLAWKLIQLVRQWPVATPLASREDARISSVALFCLLLLACSPAHCLDLWATWSIGHAHSGHQGLRQSGSQFQFLAISRARLLIQLRCVYLAVD